MISTACGQFNGTYVREGTTPPGSTWAMNPLPRNDTANTGARSAEEYLVGRGVT